MNTPAPKNAVLGVTGSIAAYKACELVRLMAKAGWNVHVVMTAAAQKFVAPLTFQTLSRNPVGLDAFAPVADWKPEHVSLAERADLLLVAPCTANFIAKLAHGFADDLLSSTALATRAPIVIAPAMNDGMWDNPATQDNLATLQRRGVRVVEPNDGELACGILGKGRMADPREIFDFLTKMEVQAEQDVSFEMDPVILSKNNNEHDPPPPPPAPRPVATQRDFAASQYQRTPRI